MNKARRHELKMLKFKKRMALYGLKPEQGKFYSFRSHSCPCSCSICSYVKYKRSEIKLRTSQELKEARCSDYNYLIP